MIPHFSDIQYFLVISETLNLSRASERLGVVQPTLSQALRRLEDAAGSPLFIRKKNGMELTAAGFVFKEKASDFVQNWNRLVSDVQGSVNLPQGRFKIGVHVSVAIYFLKSFLPELLHKNPLIEIDLSHGLSREIFEDVVSGKVDFGLVMNPRQHPDLVIRPILKDRVGLWRSPKKSSDSDLVIADFSLSQTEFVLKKTKKIFLRKMDTSSLELIGQLAQEGVGVGVLPERVAALYHLEPLAGTAWFPDELCLCYHKERQKSFASKIVIEAIKNFKN